MKPEKLIALIREAFADAAYPGDWNLRGSNLGTEPYDVEDAFRGRTRWQDVPVRLLDEAPNGLSSALCFFSHNAFRFYLPAYLIADVNAALRRVAVVFHLTHGLDDKMWRRRDNQSATSCGSWFDYASKRFSGFNPAQCRVIVNYLHFVAKRKESTSLDQRMIKESLKNYWLQRYERPDPEPASGTRRRKKRSRGRWEKDPEDYI